MRTKLHYYLLLGIQLLGFASVYAQTPVYYQRTEVLPKSPSTASLMKYAESNVDLSTGANNVQIPLYTIDVEGYKLPISISNSGTAIRVDETPGVMGIGWALNAGGTISFSESFGTAYDTYVGNPPVTSDHYDTAFHGSFVDTALRPNTSYLGKGTIRYNCAGYTGKIEGNASVDFHHGDELIKIQRVGKGIKFTNGEGVQFIFGEANPTVAKNSEQYTERSGRELGPFSFDCKLSDYMSNIGFTDIDDRNLFYIDDGDGYMTYQAGFEKITGLYLREIILPNSNNKITFEYYTTKDYKYMLGDELAYVSDENFFNDLIIYNFKRSFSIGKTIGRSLKKISWPNGSIDFVYGDNPGLRYDVDQAEYETNFTTEAKQLIPSFNAEGTRLLDKLIIKNVNSIEVKSFKFKYIYNDYSKPSEARPFLHKIFEHAGNDTIPPYIFNYNINFPVQPTFFSNYVDFWGFFNFDFDRDDAYRLHKLPILDRTTSIPSGYTETALNTYLSGIQLNPIDKLSPFDLPYHLANEPNTEYSVLYNRRSNESIKYGLLTKIEYSTGGYDEFEHEICTLAYNYGNVARNVIGGGVRLKKRIRRFDTYEDNYAVDNYTYGYGRLLYVPQFGRSYFRASEETQFHVADAIHGNPINSANGPNFSYSYVKVTSTDGGRNEYYFCNPYYLNGDVNYYDNVYSPTLQTLKNRVKITGDHMGYKKRLDYYPYYSTHSIDWVLNKTWKELVYDASENLISEKINEYDFEIIHNTKKCNVDILNDVVNLSSAYTWDARLKSVYRFTDINEIYGKAKLMSCTTRTYDSDINNYKTDITQYEYNSKRRVRTEITKNNNDDMYKKETMYIYDYNDGIGSDISSINDDPNKPELMAAKELISKNILSFPIAHTTYVKKPSESYKVLASDFKLYKPNSLGTVPWKDYYLLLDEPADDVNIFEVDDNLETFGFDERYTLFKTINGYNVNNMPTEIYDRTVGTVSYIWGYNHNLPVAEIKNGKITQTAVGNNTSYLGFESGKKFHNGAQDEEIDFWTFDPSNAHLFNQGYTGNYSVRFEPTENVLLQRDFTPESNTNSLIVSGWIKPTSNVNVVKNININCKKNNTNHAQFTISTIQNSNDWQYFRVKIDVDNSNATYKLQFICSEEMSDADILLDDLRVQPQLSEMTTYTYETIHNNMTSVSDNNNKPSFFEYDNFGRMTLKRDFQKNILNSNLYILKPKN